jgi:hypothetical protein
MKGWHVLAATLWAFYGYYFWPKSERPDAYYVATGVLILTLALRLWPFARSRADHLACAVCLVEATQHSACGLVLWGAIATGEDLCKRAAGHELYVASASFVVAAAIAWWVRAWHNRT